MKKTKHNMTLDMVLEYPKVFDHTRYVVKDTGEEITYSDYKSGNYEGDVEVDTSDQGKPGDVDRGDPKAQAKWLRDLNKNPEAKVNAYFTSEEQIEFLKDFVGFDNEVKNPQTGTTSTRIKEGNSELGIGQYIQLKRKMDDIKEFPDKNGNIQTMDKGGLPTVKILTAEGDKYVEYDYDTLGSPANGTEAKVRFEPRYMRLEALGITNLIEYSDEGYDEEDDF